MSGPNPLNITKKYRKPAKVVNEPQLQPSAENGVSVNNERTQIILQMLDRGDTAEQIERVLSFLDDNNSEGKEKEKKPLIGYV